MNGIIPFVISDLRERPDFSATVADRVWRAWWQPKGVPFEYIAGRVRENLTSGPLPFCLVAHKGDSFLGTASVIVSDMEERADLTPWVAAAWVEPERRHQGIGSALVQASARAARERGVGTIYLCTAPATRSFYELFGWRLHEANVSGLDVLVY